VPFAPFVRGGILLSVVEIQCETRCSPDTHAGCPVRGGLASFFPGFASGLMAEPTEFPSTNRPTYRPTAIFHESNKHRQVNSRCRPLWPPPLFWEEGQIIYSFRLERVSYLATNTLLYTVDNQQSKHVIRTSVHLFTASCQVRLTHRPVEY
jgi:hypothetical protein